MATDVTATTQQPATTSSVTEVNNSDSDSDDQDDESDQSEHLTVDDGNGEFDTDSDQNEDDFMTDQEAEEESDHDDCMLRWQKPQTWDKDKTEHPLLEELGELEWKVPGDRTSCKSQNTGPEQNPKFRVRVQNDKYLRLFLDALPVDAFWKRVVVKQSKIYGEKKVCDHC